MKKLFGFLCFLVLSFFFVLPVSAKENDKITLYLFYGDTMDFVKYEYFSLSPSISKSYSTSPCVIG